MGSSPVWIFPYMYCFPIFPYIYVLFSSMSCVILSALKLLISLVDILYSVNILLDTIPFYVFLSIYYLSIYYLFSYQHDLPIFFYWRNWFLSCYIVPAIFFTKSCCARLYHSLKEGSGSSESNRSSNIAHDSKSATSRSLFNTKFDRNGFFTKMTSFRWLSGTAS